MAQITININNREYAISCADGEEAHILQLASVLDEKARMFTQGGMQVNENMLLAMVGLVLADEAAEAKKGFAAPAPAIKEVVKEVVKEVAVTPDFTETDKIMAEAIKEVTASVLGIAKKIESL